jgi:tetratricopeptide (TPR) repeat protein
MEINIRFLEGTLGEAIDKANSFLNKYKEELSDPEYADKGYRLELRVACDMVNDGQYRGASELIQRLLPKAKEGDRALLYLYAGVAFAALGESKEAITSFQRVLRENGGQDQLARANYHLGAQYLKNGAAAWAKQHFLEAERLGLPADISPKDLYRFLADTCAYLGELEERDRYARLARR